MQNSKGLHKAFLYIVIQLVALSSLFYQLKSSQQEGRFETIGTILLLTLLLLYAHKTIKLLSREKAHLKEPEAGQS